MRLVSGQEWRAPPPPGELDVAEPVYRAAIALSEAGGHWLLAAGHCANLATLCEARAAPGYARALRAEARPGQRQKRGGSGAAGVNNPEVFSANESRQSRTYSRCLRTHAQMPQLGRPPT